MTPRERANAQQRIASDPAVSAFVAASAGSGKTKLLTDRLLRLMLAGAEPQRIQCLTFTKAAAAEMSLRLQRVLGRWVTLDDAQLTAELSRIGVDATDPVLVTARALFARVLDLPGGMRIGTIHAFCQSLLRRFPLEAELSPHFQLVDERDAALSMTRAREEMLADANASRRGALEAMARQATLDQFAGLVSDLQRDGGRFAAMANGALAPRLRRLLGASSPEQDAQCANWPEASALRLAFALVARNDTPAKAGKAKTILDWLDLDPATRAEHWNVWRDAFLTKAGEHRKISTFFNKALAVALPELADLIAAEQERIQKVEDGKAAAKVATLTTALVSLAAPVVDLYAARKTVTGQLDYDDLITRTAALLVDPGAAWVLFKLDGGLDHLLLDEVQDTAPAQWQIAGALTADFFTGHSAREQNRTVFAVGDRKQSIYGFQGADPDAFESWRGILRERVQRAGAQWQDVALDVSFRSTAAVLDVVDAVFSLPDIAAGVTDAGVTGAEMTGARLRHIPDRIGQAGIVELWPLTPRPVQEPADPWTIQTENRRQTSATQRLADAVAAWISGLLASGTRLESQDRPIGAGDILVLVRRRNAFQQALVRALKTRGVAVAGLDRMVLTEQPAVADLMALCDTLLLPEDDLSLACVLTSPLGGLTDDELMALAAPRTGTLWEALGRSQMPAARAAYGFILPLLSRVDHASPHALLTEALGPLGGRARLFARLGPEAAEPVDELLAASLKHAQTHPPSLQGFLHWLRQSASEVQREPEGPGGEGFDTVRIMTVHGAKGLQAPIVILPDTTALPPQKETLLWAEDAEGALPVWTPRKELRCDTANALRTALLARQAEEQNRLLYVALTRAEDRLLICGAEPNKALPDTSWYAQIRRGFEAIGATPTKFDAIPEAWPGDVLRHECAQTLAATRPPTAIAVAHPPLPGWIGTAPLWKPAALPAEPALPHPLAPSRPEGVRLGDIPEATSPLLQRDTSGNRFRRGQLVHSLLQHLPDLPAADREEAALRYLSQPGQNIPDPAALTHEVLAVLDHPDLAPLFGPHSRAEVPLSGVIAGQVIGGLIDRLAILPDRILLADYKTNRAAPATVQAVPVLYLRQLAAYRALLQAIHPGTDIECRLIWTADAHAMQIPPSLLDGHAPGATRST